MSTNPTHPERPQGEPRYFVLPPVDGGYAWWSVRDRESQLSTNVVAEFSIHQGGDEFTPGAKVMAEALCDRLNDIHAAHIDHLTARVRELERERWVCFHCGFETSDPAEAQAHFGERDDAEEFTPLCRWWSKLTTEERAQEIQDLQRQITTEQDDNAQLRTRIEGLEYQVESQRSEIHSFKPFRQCDTIQQVFNVYDSIEGRALAAEEERDRLIKENGELRQAFK